MNESPIQRLDDAHYGRHDVSNLNMWTMNIWPIITMQLNRVQRMILGEAEYVGTHRCWVGESGDYINGECAHKPHMWLYCGRYVLSRRDGTEVWPDARTRPPQVVVRDATRPHI
jgi:hypothetical protein